jgi:hypothetical protein
LFSSLLWGLVISLGDDHLLLRIKDRLGIEIFLFREETVFVLLSMLEHISDKSLSRFSLHASLILAAPHLTVGPAALAKKCRSERFPDLPFLYRRSVIKDAIGKVRSYLSNSANWQQSGRKKGKPGLPGASNHPTLHEGAFSLELAGRDLRESGCRVSKSTRESAGPG